MAKRFHDTEIWEEDWFIALPRDYRDLWLYAKDKCDHAGVWRPNTATFNKLYDLKVNIKKALELFNNGKERIKVLTNGRWLIIDFIFFQYGNHLNPNNRVHLSIMRVLEQNGVNFGSIRGLNEDTHSPMIIGLKDKDKDKDYKGVVKGEMTDTEFIGQLKANIAYKGIDIDRELGKMDAWFLTPKGKGRQKTRRFIVNWLNKIDKPVNLKPEVRPQTREDHKKERPHDPKVSAMIHETVKAMK